LLRLGEGVNNLHVFVGDPEWFGDQFGMYFLTRGLRRGSLTGLSEGSASAIREHATRA
jgi:hypothetical protein